MKNLAKVNSSRTFGIEIEFTTNGNTSQQEVARRVNQAFRNVDVVMEGYNHNTRDHWKIITDSTCGLELVSPILKGKQGLKEAQRVIDQLASVDGVVVNRSCGIHVHVGCEDVTAQGMKNVLVQYTKNQTIINSVLAPSRHDSRWCRPVYNGNVETLVNNLRNCDTVSSVINTIGDRYRTVNVQCWNRYRTIEFRQHGGSVDSVKICNWVSFLLNTVDKAIATTTPISTKIANDPKKAFKQCFGGSKVVLDFMLGRANHFGNTQYGTPVVNEVTARWEAVCELTAKIYHVCKWTNGSFTVQIDFDNVNSNRKELLFLLGAEDTNQTTRQLGNKLFELGGLLNQVEQMGEQVA